MLRRLELVGFKSFADKTVFTFGDGITGIVGPNGSGKSNIVDAVRWIMGEQSAKSLRGGEMTDVIFNGSSSRRSLGLAEVTMTFDNTRRQLALDADEVQITRRVYRDGEGEYLINSQVCRLKDIKEMFLGSGAGNDAYCIIAQGRVDALLQASTKERRTIFEEAAGISRFKAKKLEALRKLEKVDLNLQRLRDIIDEVEKQLRSVKLQASKAQRYQEYAERLKELRLTLGLDEYRQLTAKLSGEEQTLAQSRGDLDQRAARAGACEAEAERLEIFLADLEDSLREEEANLARVLQRIKTEETTLGHESTLTNDLEAELRVTRKRLTELTQHVGSLAETARAAEEEWARVEAQARHQRDESAAHEETLRETLLYFDALGAQISSDKAEHLEQMRRSARLQNEAVSRKAQVDNLRRERDRLRQRSEQAAAGLASLDVELQDLQKAEAELGQRLHDARGVLHEQRQRQEQLRELHDRATDRINELRQQRSGLASRVEMLEGLIRGHEGLGTGVREVIALIEQPEPGPWRTVVGMIADFLTVKREYAPLIDLALGDWAQRFIVRDNDLFVQALDQRRTAFSGRVSFLPLHVPDANDVNDPVQAALRGNRQLQMTIVSQVKQTGFAATPDHPGLVAPAEQLVSCEHPDLADLPAQLLGRTLIVRDLATARLLASHAPGFRFVTLHGELLEPDGTLTVGTHHAETGILSRKSELRELREQLEQLDLRLAETNVDLAALREQMLAGQSILQEQQQTIDVLGEQSADLRSRVQRHRDRRQGLHEEVSVSRDEMQRIEQEVVSLDNLWQDARTQAAQAEANVQELHARIHAADAELRQLDLSRQQQQQTCTLAQVALAKIEERLHSLRNQHLQASREHQQRRQEWQQGQQNVGTLRIRLQESQRTMLQASAILAHAFLEKEKAQIAVAAMESSREQKRLDRARLTQQAQAARVDWRKVQERVHQRELESTNLRHQLETLLQKLREDYQVDLAELDRQRQTTPTNDDTTAHEPAPLAERFDPQAALAEIDELRRKLAKLGSVNLEALQEMQELEKRAGEQQAQFDDLTNAKKSLEEIIGKINGDSRKMFSETLATIRIHFQELFRKLFGGGMADIILEDETDVLESGIEINARPPGKELRGISLMSGGEKTLTAVALLLAIFRSKPSPFCLLDEVDAALDEANIARFTAVIREYCDRSQFIIVTHSKKTMSCADVLYGITMQESGISKQVTIRFEDWVDEPNPDVAQAS
jgi:chromosome segregation protein